MPLAPAPTPAARPRARAPRRAPRRSRAAARARARRGCRAGSARSRSARRSRPRRPRRGGASASAGEARLLGEGLHEAGPHVDVRRRLGAVGREALVPREQAAAQRLPRLRQAGPAAASARCRAAGCPASTSPWIAAQVVAVHRRPPVEERGDAVGPTGRGEVDADPREVVVHPVVGRGEVPVGGRRRAAAASTHPVHRWRGVPGRHRHAPVVLVPLGHPARRPAAAPRRSGRPRAGCSPARPSARAPPRRRPRCARAAAAGARRSRGRRGRPRACAGCTPARPARPGRRGRPGSRRPRPSRGRGRPRGSSPAGPPPSPSRARCGPSTFPPRRSSSSTNTSW